MQTLASLTWTDASQSTPTPKEEHHNSKDELSSCKVRM